MGKGGSRGGKGFGRGGKGGKGGVGRGSGVGHSGSDGKGAGRKRTYDETQTDHASSSHWPNHEHDWHRGEQLQWEQERMQERMWSVEQQLVQLQQRSVNVCTQVETLAEKTRLDGSTEKTKRHNEDEKIQLTIKIREKENRQHKKALQQALDTLEERIVTLEGDRRRQTAKKLDELTSFNAEREHKAELEELE